MEHPAQTMFQLQQPSWPTERIDFDLRSPSFSNDRFTFSSCTTRGYHEWMIFFLPGCVLIRFSPGSQQREATGDHGISVLDLGQKSPKNPVTKPGPMRVKQREATSICLL